jgi:hypothetical protein
MQVARTIYRAALLHLSVNPFLGRASIGTTWSSLSAPNPRLHSILFPQCATFKLDNKSQFRTMCDSSKPSDPSPGQTQNTNTQEPDQNDTPGLYLPESDGTAAHQAQGSGGIKLDMSGGDTAVKLDHLGPMVVNVDGTLSQIGNWQQMTEGEQQNTLRIIGKRNQKRLEALRAKEKAGE